MESSAKVLVCIAAVLFSTVEGIKIGAISYWDSTTAYNTLPKSGIALINPDSGIIKASSSDVQKYGQIIKNIKAQYPSVSILGYVPTGYGDRSTRPYSTIQADVKAYFGNYSQLNGIFFDEIGNDCNTVKSTMSQLRIYVNDYKSGAKITWNPGWVGDNWCYVSEASSGEIVMDFESSYSDYKSSTTQSDLDGAKTKKNAGVLTWHAVYSVPSSTDMQSVVDKAKGFAADYVYVTNLGTPNPYGSPPSYWQAEISYVA